MTNKLSTTNYFKTMLNTALTTKYADPEKYHQYVLSRGRGRLAKHIADIAKQETNKKQATALDLGAGTGIISNALQDKGFTVTATDADPAMVQMLKKMPGVTAKRVDINKPFKLEDNSFDVVTTVWANRYIRSTSLDSFMHEVLRVLKPGGTFIWPLFVADHVIWKMRSGLAQPTTPKALNKRLTAAGFVDMHIDRERKKRNRQTKELPNWIYPVYVIAKKSSL